MAPLRPDQAQAATALTPTDRAMPPRPIPQSPLAERARMHAVVLAASIALWAALSLTTVAIHAFQHSPWVRQFLLDSRFDPRYFLFLSKVSLGDILYFQSLFVPRLLFLVLCLHLLRKAAEGRRSSLPTSPGFLLFLVAILAASELARYEPAILATLYLLSFVLGRLSGNPWRMLLTLPVLLALLLTADLERGPLLSLLVAFILGRGRLDAATAAVLPALFGVAVVLATWAKFSDADNPVLANLFDRISNFHQLRIYLLGAGPAFTTGRPVSMDLLGSLPVLRSFLPQLDEVRLFYDVTHGSAGGLAVGPEIRSLAYWQDGAWIHLDLAIAFALLFAILWVFVRRIPYGVEGFAMIFVQLIQFDSINAAPITLQLMVIFTLVASAYRALQRFGRTGAAIRPGPAVAGHPRLGGQVA